jgi:hypothetical protein
LEELVLYLKIGGSQADFQQLHDGFDLQDRPFCQCDIVVELIFDDGRWTKSENPIFLEYHCWLLNSVQQ